MTDVEKRERTETIDDTEERIFDALNDLRELGLALRAKNDHHYRMCLVAARKSLTGKETDADFVNLVCGIVAFAQSYDANHNPDKQPN